VLYIAPPEVEVAVFLVKVPEFIANYLYYKLLHLKFLPYL
jgi:hypothetical protein